MLIKHMNNVVVLIFSATVVVCIDNLICVLFFVAKKRTPEPTFMLAL